MKDYSVFFANYTIGTDAFECVVDVCGKYGSKAFLIGGEKALKAGKDILKSAIGGSKIEIVATEIYGKECTYSAINRLADMAKELGADMIFGMGGGKALDTAKGAANVAGIPFFTFPTISSTCAATTALSVVYEDDGEFKEFFFFDKPAAHCFINTSIISRAPIEYLRAGMGDTIGKYFESHFSSRNDELEHSSALGVEISNLCYTPIKKYGEAAMSAAKQNQPNFALEQVVLAIIVTTGMVSLLVEDMYNCAVAHSVYYGLVLIPGFEEHNLHGNVVAYGVLVQLAIDKKEEELLELKEFLKKIGIATTLKEMGVSIENDVTPSILNAIVSGPDMEHIPYEIDENMILSGMKQAETL